MTKRVQILAIFAAVVVHAGILLFGGLLLLPQHRTRRVLVNDVNLEAEQKPEEKPEQKTEKDLEVEKQARPDTPPPELKEDAAPLDLAQLEMAMSGATGGGGDFLTRLPATLGGRGGLAVDAVADTAFDAAFSLADLDQAPRATFQPAPEYPSALRRQKLDGSVQVLFIVNPDGRVANPVAQAATHPAFEQPALQAVRRWRFEPGKRNGQPVSFKMRVPIRFRSR